MKWPLALAPLAFTVGCTMNLNHTQYRADDTPSRKIVIYDEGGFMEHRMRQIDELNAVNAKIEIRGACISACTMFLGADNVCVHPDARLGFHGAMEFFFVPATPAKKLEYDTNIASYYPPNLRRWFMEDGRNIVVLWHTKTGQQVHDMDPDHVALC